MARWAVLSLNDGRRLQVDIDSLFDDGHLDEAEIDQACRKLRVEATRAGVTTEELAASKFRVVEADFSWTRMEIKTGSGVELLFRGKPRDFLSGRLTLASF